MSHAKLLLAVLSVGAAAVSIAAASLQAPEPRTDWRYFGGDKAFTRYSPLAQISRDNVRNLRIAWRRPAVNPKMIAAFPDTRPNAYLRSTPIMVDGVLYTQDAHGLVIALDGETGQTIWEQPFGSAREDASGPSTRGVDYWRGGTGRGPRRPDIARWGGGNADKRILAIRGEYLYALDAATGRRCRRLEPRGGLPAVLRFDASGKLVRAQFSNAGKFIKTWGRLGSGPGEFKTPHALAFDSQGRLFVADRGNNRVQIFDRAGKYVDSWSQFGRPSDVHIDMNGILYVADSESGSRYYPGWRRGVRIARVTDGRVTYLIHPHQTDRPEDMSGEGVTVDAQGHVYSSELGTHGGPLAVRGITKYIARSPIFR